jgi:hypothetical protein
MITVREFMEVCNYRITEGSDYCWQCFGPRAYQLDSWNGDQNGHTVGIVFDNRTQVVYQASVYDYKNQRAYRMTNPDFKSAFDKECEDRYILDMAWEDDEGNPVKYIDLEVVEDFVSKAKAIVNDEEYDTRIEVPLDLPNDLLFELMKMAHDRDMTLNQLVEEIIKIEIQRLEVKGSPAMITGKKSKKKKK